MNSLAKIEQTIAILLKNKDVKANDFKNLDIATLQVLEELIFNNDDLNDLSSSFKGMIIVKIHPEGDISFKCKAPELISDADKNVIGDWMNEKNHTIYSNDYYRLDLSNFIILFKIYKFNKNQMFIGHAVENSAISKIDLLEARQEYMMREFV